MNTLMIFNSVIVVLWTVAFVQQFIREKQWWLFIGSYLVLLLIEIRLMRERWEFPLDIVASVGCISFAALAGCINYLLIERKKSLEEADERVDRE